MMLPPPPIMAKYTLLRSQWVAFRHGVPITKCIQAETDDHLPEKKNEFLDVD